MSEKNLLIKRVNRSKFDDFKSYDWVSSAAYNIFERCFIRRVLKNNSPEGEFALDIGSGVGVVIREMYHIYGYCVGLDISRGILHHAKSYLKGEEKRNVDLICADAEYMPFKNSAFDVVTMYSVLHHLPNVRASLRETNRIMSPKSNLILFHEPNEARVRQIFKKTVIKILGKVRSVLVRSIHKRKWRQYKHEAQHRSAKLGNLEKLADIHAPNGFSISEMRTTLKKRGFEVIQIKTRMQCFMTAFSRLAYPYKSFAVLDFFLSEMPILKDYLPLLLCIAKKNSVSPNGENACAFRR